MPKVALMLGLAALTAIAQDKPGGFLLDSSKPYVYLTYDHIGPRTLHAEGQETVGLWLRIVNNCRIPIAIGTFRETSRLSVPYHVIPIEGIEKSANANIVPVEQTSGNPVVERPKKVPPGSSSDLLLTARIEPGKDFLFSVPRNTVSSANWFVRISVWLAVGPSVGPFTQLDFFEDYIPLADRKSTR